MDYSLLGYLSSKTLAFYIYWLCKQKPDLTSGLHNRRQMSPEPRELLGSHMSEKVQCWFMELEGLK